MADVVRTETALYCPVCNHSVENHARLAENGCSHGWCRCPNTIWDVQEVGESRERRVFAAKAGPR